MSILRLLRYFVIGGISGYLWERYVIGKKGVKDTLISKLGLGTLPFLSIYGIGYVIMYILGAIVDTMLPEKCPKLHRVIIKSSIATVVLSGIECIIGKISYRYNGYMTWDYGDVEDCPKSCIIGCSGYTSPEATLAWGVSSVIFYSLN